ncbi:amino acid adenylation domain-containing protein [Nocardia sp. NPDC005978]|uniref:non-ribosomal peptide synthetase n=1 Tax=Nocardia sp. NPDC005978 TaxID=3156725 RepID=UPI00339DADC7
MRGRGVVSLLGAAVAQHPDGCALVGVERTLTYRELDEESNRLGRRLCALGAGPEDRVAIVLPRSVDSVSATWAIAKSGAAFVPVDPAYPRARVEYLLVDSGCAFGVTFARYLEELPGHIRWLVLDDPRVAAELTAESPRAISYVDRRSPLRPANLAYLIYTSGSTGRPKGVGVTHAGVPALTADLHTSFATHRDARVLHFASPSFDASILELLLAVGACATLVIAPPTILGGGELADFLHRHRITHAFLTPSVLASLDARELETLTTIAVGGEPCAPALVRRWSSPRRRFHNIYGPTESTIAATLTGPLREADPVPIGRPVDGVGYRILDTWLRPVAPGAVGELYVSGPAVARGYPGHPEQTAMRFVADVLGPPGARMYRTGDLVRHNRDGELEYRGRGDHQVKIRGHRIELGEIDATLGRMPGVADAVTVDRTTSTGSIELVAFVRTEHAPAHTFTAELRAWLAAELPSFMQPNSIRVLEEFPLTPSGKVDRAALAAHTARTAPVAGASGIGDDLVREVFVRVLGTRDLDGDSDFFAAGGNSLLATQAAARLSEIWQLRIPPQLLFEYRTPALLTAAIRTRHFETARPPLLAGVRPERIPLSANQLRFWLRNQFDTAAAVDNIGFALRLEGVDVPALTRALLDVVTRHEALRTRYPADEHGPHQLIEDPEAILDRFGVEEVSDAGVDARVRDLLWQGFDVTSEVPLRVRLLHTPSGHLLVCALHHICADGSSMAPLARDLADAYGARLGGVAPTWPALAVQYADYALWQRELLGSREDPDSLLSQQLRYWQTELAGLPDQLDLPADRRRPNVASLRGATLDRTLPAQMHTALLDLAHAQQASLFMVMRTALAVLLARLSGTSDISIGVPMTVRSEPALDGVAGMFVNTTVSRTSVDLAESFTDLLARTRTRDLSNFAHSEVPFELVVDAVDPVRSPGRHPLYQVGFAFQNFTQAALSMPGITTSMLDVAAETVKSDLHIGVIDTHGEDGAPGLIGIRFGYSTDLFDRATIERFLDGYIRVLESILADPRRRVGDLALVRDDDPELSSHGAVQEIPVRTLAGVVARHAELSPDEIAVVCGGESITYRLLAERIARLARWLIQERAVGPESIVAIATHRSIDQVVAMHATVDAGAAWVPIDPDHPADRIGYVLASAQPHCVLSTTADRFAMGGVHLIDTLDLSAYSGEPVSGAERTGELRPDHAAYVMYTSGSTGRPKGVVITHEAIANQVEWMCRRYEVGARDVYLHKTAATFDVSLWGYFVPLWAGSRLILALPGEHRDPDAICRAVAAHGVTLTDVVPAMAALIAQHPEPEALRTLRALFVIGEALPPETVRTFAEICSAEVHNLYGPTEAAVSITERHVRASDLDEPRLPIGLPAWNSQCRVLDARLRPVPRGVTGELFLSGVQLARGYKGSPGLTAGRFVADPFGPPGARAYRSGDLARLRSDGELDFLGRTDLQVKVRGHRIELGEIESALLGNPAIAQAAVTAQRAGGDVRLLGYVVPAPGQDVDSKSLRRKLSDVLPGYMLPAVITVLAAFPTNSSGKVDRAALPLPAVEDTDEIGSAAPESPVEIAIAEVFAEVLGVGRVGVTDSFFDLGGSSLGVFDVHRRLSARLERDVPMRAILSAPTVAGLAAHIANPPAPAVVSSHAADAVLAQEISPAGCAPAAPGAASEILLTGATGFLGVHLLDELLRSTDARVWCLIRADSDAEARARIMAALGQFRLRTDGIEDRVRVLCGDLSLPDFGLAASDFELLTERIDAIYHNGARVNHVDPYERLRAANVEGTRTVLRLATTVRAKAVHFVSTLGAAIPSGTRPDLVAESDRLTAGQLQDNGYLISKWVGEELIRQAGERGLPVTILRPGTVSAHTVNAVGNPQDGFWNMVGAAATLGLAPDVGEATISLVPVDYVARAIVAIGSGPHRETVYHLVNHQPTSIPAVLDSLRSHGVEVRVEPLDAVRRELERRASTAAASDRDVLARAALLSPTYAGLAAHARWSDTNTRAALAGTTIECPPIDRTVLSRYMGELAAAARGGEQRLTPV